MKRKIFLWLVSALAIGGILSLFASQNPDGYEKVGEELGFIQKATTYFSTPFADYTIGGGDSWLSNSLAGIIGVILTFVAFIILGKILGNRNT